MNINNTHVYFLWHIVIISLVKFCIQYTFRFYLDISPIRCQTSYPLSLWTLLPFVGLNGLAALQLAALTLWLIRRLVNTNKIRVQFGKRCWQCCQLQHLSWLPLRCLPSDKCGKRICNLVVCKFRMTLATFNSPLLPLHSPLSLLSQSHRHAVHSNLAHLRQISNL